MYGKLLSKINQSDGDTAQLRSDLIVRNKIEFNSYPATFFEKNAGDLMQTQLSSELSSSVSTIRSGKSTVRSKASSGFTVKFLEVKAEFKAAQVLAQQANERVKKELQFQQLLANQTQYKVMRNSAKV